MRILVVGGGIAGLAFAALAKKYNLGQVTLIERAPKFGTIGYAIALWGTGRRVLKEIGLDHEVVQKGYEIPWDALEDNHGRLLQSFYFNAFKGQDPTLVISRTDIHEALAKAIVDNVDLRLGTTLVKLEQNPNKTIVTFSDNRSRLVRSHNRA